MGKNNGNPDLVCENTLDYLCMALLMCGSRTHNQTNTTLSSWQFPYSCINLAAKCVKSHLVYDSVRIDRTRGSEGPAALT